MANCGADHGKVCTEIDTHEKEITKLWAAVGTRLAVRVFAWSCSVVAAIFAFTLGWTQANNSTLNVLQQQQAVAIARIDHNREVVSQQYTTLRDAINELKHTISKQTNTNE